MAKLTPEEQKEFSQLKHTRCKYGFLTSPEEMRYNELWDKNAKGTLEALNNFERVANQIDNN